MHIKEVIKEKQVKQLASDIKGYFFDFKTRVIKYITYLIMVRREKSKMILNKRFKEKLKI